MAAGKAEMVGLRRVKRFTVKRIRDVKHPTISAAYKASALSRVEGARRGDNTSLRDAFLI
jgi:hypothetical protein